MTLSKDRVTIDRFYDEFTSTSITAEALKADGVTADTITVESDDERIATVDGDTITIEAMGLLNFQIN
mgnify:CR=1 FL=1